MNEEELRRRLNARVLLRRTSSYKPRYTSTEDRVAKGITPRDADVRTEKPRQSFFNKVRDVFDANTDADKYRRQLAGLPRDFKQASEITRSNNVQSTETNPFKRVFQEITEAPRRIGVGAARTTQTQRDVEDTYLREQRYTTDNILKAQQKIKDPNVSRDEKIRWANYLIKTYPQSIQRDAEIRRELGRFVKDTDQTAALAALAEMGIDIATLGLGGKAAAAAAKSGIRGARFAEPVISGAAGGGVGAITGQGSDVTLQQIGLGTVAGGTIGAAFPALGALFGRVAGRGVNPQAFINSIVADSSEASIKKQLQGLGTELSEQELDQLSKLLSKQTDVNTVAATLDGFLSSRQSNAVDKGLGNYFAGVTDEAPIRETVDGLFPGLSAKDRNALVVQIRKSDTAESIEKAISEARIKSQQVTEKIDEVTPEKAVTTADEVDAAIESAPPSSKASQGEQLDTSKQKDIDQGKVPSNEQLVEAGEANKALYEQTNAEKIRDKAREIWDPFIQLRDIDKRFRKSIKTKFKNLDKTESLEALGDNVRNYKQSVEAYLNSGRSAIKSTMEKYARDEQTWTDFNQYRVFKGDLERRLDGRPAIERNLPNEVLERRIAEFEARYPEFEADLRAINQEVNALEDYVVSKSGLGPEAVRAARTKKDGTTYEFYSPVRRALPEDVERARLAVGDVLVSSRQNTLKELTGSEIPLDYSGESLIDFIDNVFRDARRGEFQSKLYDRAEGGFIDKAKVIQTPGQYRALLDARQSVRELIELRNSLRKEASKVKRRVSSTRKAKNQATKRAQSQAKAAEKAAVNRVKTELRKSGLDNAELAALESLDTEDFITILMGMAEEPNLTRTGFKTTGSATAAKNLGKSRKAYEVATKKSAAHQSALDKLNEIVSDIEATDNALIGFREDIGSMRLDPLTGRQVVTGRIGDNQFKLELPPEVARVMQGLGDDGVSSFNKAMKTAQAPFRQSYTGVLNPSFQIAQTLYNTMMLPFTTGRGLSVFNPKHILEGFKAMGNSKLFKDMQKNNSAVVYGGGLQQLGNGDIYKGVMRDITGMEKYKDPRVWWKKFDALGGKIDRWARGSAASLEYDKAINAGLSKEAALANASYAWNNALPNFGRLSGAVRNLDSVLMYGGATQTGTRTFLRGLRENPGVGAAMLGGVGTSVAAVNWHNQSNEQMQKFYEEMIRSDKEYVLDNNLVIGINPRKNEETGEWEGIIKIPVAPELRPVFSQTWKTVYGITTDEATQQELGIQGNDDLSNYALTMFDFMTGDARSLNNPTVNLGYSLMTGKDVRNGYTIYEEGDTDEEKRVSIERFIANQFGTAGRALYAELYEDEGSAFKEYMDSIVNRAYGQKGISEGANYYITRKEGYDATGISADQRSIYENVIAPSRRNKLGQPINDKTVYDSETKASALLRDMDSHPEGQRIIDVMKFVDERARREGKPGDPFYDLEEWQQKIVLTRQAAPENRSLKKAIMEQNPWLEDFYSKRGEYYDQVKATLSDEEKDKFGLSPLGIKRPTASNEIQTLQEAYSKLETDPGIADDDRAATKAKFLEDNPQLTEYWAQQEEFERAEREYKNLPLYDLYPQPSPEVEAGQKEFFALGSKEQRSNWINANKELWAQMQEHWFQRDVYRVQTEGELAVYEGFEFSEKGLESIQDISDYLYQQGGGRGGSYGGGGDYAPWLNISALLQNVGRVGGREPRVNQRAQAPKLRFKPLYTSGKKPNVIKFK